ncbi:FAD:protein FMN transferase [Thalassomonas sp. M1454]|uniref:FAD:protein FMN transferase n=1 Tax=Thalassomonas sp. M1454 TaxID=2594477 RepID=UPI00117FAEB8|nr:FAD:protein FMN transferase [Thalassomonas sp. M1454]TRX55801.1 FAD:protein FMN transferase [Thalassomonas sp. M1454]
MDLISKTYQFKGMGSPCEFRLIGPTEALIDEAFELGKSEVARLEQKYSRYQTTSFLSQINQQAGKQAIDLDSESQALFSYAKQAYDLSDGLFDVTSGVMRNVWDMNSSAKPDTSKIDYWLNYVGFEKIDFSQNCIYVPEPNMQIDLGGIVKEYAADSIANILSKFSSLSGLINLGGDIAIVSNQQKPKVWQVGITDPNNAQQAIANIPLISGGVATSGDYERYIIIDNKRYSHVISPKTGYPVSGLLSVSVWQSNCILAGTLATIAMLKEQQGCDWLKQLDIPYFAVKDDLSVVTHQI